MSLDDRGDDFPRRLGGTGTWPPFASEEVDWWPGDDRGFPATRRTRRSHSGNYQAAIPSTIAKMNPILPPAVTALADEASQEIVRFDGELGEISPVFSSLMLRTESASSSQIENLTSSAKALAISAIGHKGRGNADMIVANVRAMETAVSHAGLIDKDSILDVHFELMKTQAASGAGEWRGEPVWIGGTSYGPHEAAYVAPQHHRIVAAMEDLIKFGNRTDVPVLTQAAIVHAQFENIHPFSDGNGRTGRALLQAMLRVNGLTRHVPVPVSAGLISRTAEYFDALVKYREGEPEHIVTAVAEAAFTAIGNGRHLAAELQEIRTSWQDSLSVRRNSAASRLRDLVLRSPVIDMPFVSRQLGVTSANSQLAIDRLADADILVQIGHGKRNRMWQAPDVLNALEAFAARAARRPAHTSGRTPQIPEYGYPGYM